MVSIGGMLLDDSLFFCYGSVKALFLLERRTDMKLSDKVYDILKWIAIVCLPALSTFIVVISKIWGWADMGSMIAQTITAIGVLLGALLGISSIQYNKGDNDADN